MSIASLQPETTSSLDYTPQRYDIRRVRFGGVMDAEKGVTRIGVTKNARELFDSLALRRLLKAAGHTMHTVDPETVPDRQNTLSDAYAEITPPLTRELAQKIGVAMVSGEILSQWDPRTIDIEREGIAVIDNTHRYPETPVDTAGHVLASSLAYR